MDVGARTIDASKRRAVALLQDSMSGIWRGQREQWVEDVTACLLVRLAVKSRLAPFEDREGQRHPQTLILRALNGGPPIVYKSSG
jgi:hypothetical protein